MLNVKRAAAFERAYGFGFWSPRRGNPKDGTGMK
jgi:hypothetical protein